jgi:hypothetical protein
MNAANLIQERERIISERKALARQLKGVPDGIAKYAKWVKPMDKRLMEINKILDL